MATSNFIVSALPAYVQENRELLIKKIVLSGSTIERMSKQTGIKKDAYLNFLNLSPAFQSGAGCGFTPSGDVSLTDREIETGLIKVDLEICPENLRGKWAEYLLGTSAGEHDLPFEAELIAELTDFITEKMETAVWQGDTTSADVNLKQFDGLLKILGNEVTVVTETIAHGSTATAAINQVWLAVPAKIIKKGISIFVSPELFRQYISELVAANLYHYPGPQGEDVDEIVLPGGNARVVMAYGLMGTANIVATWDRNLVYGTDLESDREVFNVTYGEREETFAVKVRWNAGVQVAFPDEVVLGTIASQ